MSANGSGAALPATTRGPRGPLTVLLALGVVLALSFPYLPFVPFSVLGNVNLAAQFTLIAISVVVLTGWVGQISLGQAGFVGVGAYVSGIATGSLHIGFPVSMLWGAIAGMVIAATLGIVALRVRGLYLAVATLIFSWMAEAFLFRQGWFTKHASITLEPIGKPDTIPYFNWTKREVIYYAAWAAVALSIFLMANVRDSKTGRAFFAVRGSEVAAASLGIDIMKTKLIAFAISGFLAGAAGGLMLAMGGSVSPDAFKVDQSLFFLSIAVVGGLSSLGGAMAAGLVFAFLNELFFRVEALGGYLTVVSAALLAGVLLLYRGGLAAIPQTLGPKLRPVGSVLLRVSSAVGRAGGDAGRWAAGMFRSASERADAARARSGAQGDEAAVVQRASRVSEWLSAATRGRIKPKRAVVRTEAPLDLFEALEPATGNGHHDPAELVVAEPAVLPPVPPEPAIGPAGDERGSAPDDSPLARAGAAGGWRTLGLRAPDLPRDREDRRPLIEAAGITVQFGGLRAVNDVTLKVCEGEIVGLIGPNGAGKTTFFNSVAGLNVPTAGTVRLFGQDVTDLPVHQRAQLGVGRTFQAIQLFGQLTVFENLLVATHQHNHTGLFSHLIVSSSSLAAERAARAQVRRALELLELEGVADRRARDLPFGVLRMVELARALVTQSRIIMLDEPASGLDNNETDRLADIVRFMRSLGVTILLIEHDVRMVTGVSDYMYVLDRGNLLAEGTPEQVQRDERVIAAYLGQADTREEVGV